MNFNILNVHIKSNATDLQFYFILSTYKIISKTIKINVNFDGKCNYWYFKLIMINQ